MTNNYVKIESRTYRAKTFLPPKKQYRVSTGQSDIRRAAPIGHALIAAKLREWNEIALALSGDTPLPAQLSADLIQIICAGRLCSWMTTDDEHRQQGIDDDTLLEIESFCELTDKYVAPGHIECAASLIWPRPSCGVEPRCPLKWF